MNYSLETVARSQGCNSAPFQKLLIGVLNMSKKALVVSSFAAVSAAPVVAMAAVPASVTTAIGDAVADVATVGAAVLGVIIGIYVFKWIRRAF